MTVENWPETLKPNPPNARRVWLSNGDTADVDLTQTGQGLWGTTWVRGWVDDVYMDINVNHIISIVIPDP